MANGYIGKISALVTASTADLSRKLQGGTRDVNRFANSVQSQIAGAASSARRSFEGIFTPLQRIQRALDAGRGTLNIIDDAQVRRFQQAVSIAEQINKPLAAASRAFQGLSADVAAGLLPALLRAQDAATRVNDEIGTTGGVTASSYRVAEQAIDRAAAAFERFRQAEQIIGSAPRGRELQFEDPQLFSALQRSAEARRGAAAPGVASRVGGALGDAVREVTRFDELVAQAAARISGIRLAPQVDTSQLERAQGEYQDLLVQQRRAVEELNRLSASPPPDPGRGFVLRQQPEQARGLGLFGRQAGSDADAAVQRAQRLSAVFDALPESARAAVGGLAGIAARVADEVATAGTGVAQLNAVLDILEGRLATSAAAADAQAEKVRRSGEAAREAAAKLTSLANAIQASLGNASPTVDSLEQDLRRLLGVVEKSPAGRTAFKPILDELLELFTAARNGADNLDQIVAKLNELRAAGARGASGGLTILSDADVQADKAKQAARTIQEARDALSQRLLGGFGGAGESGLNLGIDERRLRGIAGEFDFLQDRIAGVGAEARGPLVSAMEQYRQTVNRAFKEGTISTRQGQKAIADSRDEVVRLAAALLNVKPGRLAEQLNRVGDVARGVGSRASLGIQQAIFAFEDFFSVTGGLDQRIRAAGNNISQLGFILGGTAGLVTGVLVSALAQGTVALIKFANANVGSEDRVKALNDSLARQRSLVQELSQAYESLADSIARSSLSPRSQRREEINRQVNAIRERQNEQARESIVGLDPEVQRQRGIQAARQRELEKTEDPARRVLLQSQINEARRREQQAADAAVNRPQVSPLEAARRAVEARRLVDEAAPLLGEGDGGPGFRERAAAIERFRAEVEGRVGGAGSEQERFDRAREVIRAEQDRLRQQAEANRVPGFGASDVSRAAEQQLLALTQTLADLERDFTASVNSAAVSAAEAALQTGDIIGSAQQRIAEIFGDSGSQLGAQADLLGSRLAQLAKEIEAAQIANDLGRVEAAQAEIAAIREQASALDIATQALDRFASALDQASQEAQSNLQSAQQAADEARRADLGRSTPQTQGAREQADADLARQRELAANVEAEVAAARERFGQRAGAFSGVEQDVEARRNEARQRAIALQDGLRARIDEITDIFQRPLGDVPSAEELRARFGDGVEDLFDLETLSAQLGKEFDLITAAFQELSSSLDAELQAAGGELVASFRRIAEIDELLQTQGVLADGQREELVRERSRLEQQAVEADEQVRRARDESTREAEQAAAATRGRELSMTDGERAAADLTRGLEDIRQFFGRQAEEGTGLVDFEAQAAAQQRFIDQSLRQAAPAIFGLADQVANAVLQGPSRAALQATDVSTVEGSRELNRLLRGDDAARDQNLVELQKQSRSLDELVRIAREGGAQVAN